MESIENDKDEVTKKNKRRKSPKNNGYVFPDMYPARRMNNSQQSTESWNFKISHVIIRL